MPQEKKGRNPRVNTGAKDEKPRESRVEEKQQCHVHDKVSDRDVVKVRANVCVNDGPLTEFEGKHYCLFHLPTRDKDIAKFERIFRARLGSVEQKIADIEEKTKDERDLAKNTLSYDFIYVWFPSVVYLSRYKFEVTTDFSWATFSADAHFRTATFSANAEFSLVTFSAHADFRAATFAAYAYFSGATFSANADFLAATFSANAEFSLVTFSAHADFRATFSAGTNFGSVTFSADADFMSAKFLETSQVFFQQTRFCKKVDFNYSVFAGYVAFEGKKGEKDEKDEYVFLDKKAVLEVKKERAEQGIGFQIRDNFEDNQEAALNLQNARIEKPERISFHRVRLCPGWFVNVDSRKMVFTDVIWDNLDRKFRNPNITAELKSLEKCEVSEPNRLLEIACFQLSFNAEENNRYEDASKFRYMAMETKRLEYAWHGRLWTLGWWYRLSSGYGENWGRAALVLLGVLLFFGLIYDFPFASFERPQNIQTIAPVNGQGAPEPNKIYKMNNSEGIVYSLYVAALQRPDPKPADTLTRFFVILETIFAPLQAALLALAIRRKFMR